MFQQMQKTAEFPHVTLIVRILEVHVVMQDKFSSSEQCNMEVAQTQYFEGIDSGVGCSS